jgi:hypothetical protein
MEMNFVTMREKVKTGRFFSGVHLQKNVSFLKKRTVVFNQMWQNRAINTALAAKVEFFVK